MSRAYIYKVVIHIKQVVPLSSGMNLFFEEDRPYYFNTDLAAKDFGDKAFDMHGWKYTFSAVPMFEDSNHGMNDAVSCFSGDLEGLIQSIQAVLPSNTVAA